MTDFPGFLQSEQNYLIATTFGRVAAAYQKAPQYSGRNVRLNDPPALSAPALTGTYTATGVKSSFAAVNYPGYQDDKATPAFDWFEKFHVVPREFALGNILSTQNIPIEVYSAFRDSSHPWSAFVNNAGAGVSLVGAPSLPFIFAPQTGKQMTLQVNSLGEATVDSTLDFVFDTGTIHVPITLQRVVLFTLPPELPYTEILEFLTDIIAHLDGTEQRFSLRKNPRQKFDWEIAMDPGIERQLLDSILFEWQSRLFGVPIWHELSFLTTPVAPAATVITVETTNFADYRIGSLALIYTSQSVYDVLTVQSLTSTSVTFTTGALNAHAIGAKVMPLRIGVLEGKPHEKRYPTDASALQLRFRIKDNDVGSIASTAAFSTFNGKVLLDDPNFVQTALDAEFDQDVYVLDNDTGQSYESSSMDRHRRGSAKTFLPRGRQRIWETRQLLHALHGRQVSLYLPTFGKDLTPLLQLSSGSSALDVSNCGYTQFVKSRQPKNVIRVTFNDGTAPLIRTVLSSLVVDATRETLTLNTSWPSTIALSRIDRIMYVEEVRLDSDSISITHLLGDRSARIVAPVKAVLE